MIQVSNQPFFNLYVTIGVIVLAMLAAIVLLKERQQITRFQAFVLATIRIALILLIGLALLRPGITMTSETTPDGVVAVVADQSASMQLPSGIATDSRWTVARDLTGQLSRANQSTASNLQFKLFTFDSDLAVVAPKVDDSFSLTNTDAKTTSATQFRLAAEALGDTATGALTDIAGPLLATMAKNIEPPLQAIVWMSDGVQTADPGNVSATQIARQMAEANVPLYLIGIGPRSGADQSLDQWVDGVPEQIDAFSKNIVDLRGFLKTVGLTNRPLKILSTLRDTSGNVISTSEDLLTPKRIEQTLPFSIPITAPARGDYEIEVRAEAIDGEATLLNNVQTCFLNVRESGSRLLYMEGEPRAEQKFIRIALADSPDLQVDFLPLLRSTQSQWPINLERTIRENQYDCFILGDLDSKALSDDSIAAIVKRVNDGAGIITLGGYHAYGPGGYDSTGLAKLLPMRISGFPRQDFGAVNKIAQITDEIELKLLKRHPIFELGAELSDQALVTRWTQLPPMQGANRWGPLETKVGVQLLAQTTQKDPMIVSGTYGSGRVLAMAFDSTALWWRGGFSDIHRRFWRQSVLWAMKSKDRQPGLKITMPKRRIRIGMTASYEVQWTGKSETEAMPNSLSVRLEKLGDQPVSLKLRTSDSPIATGEISPLKTAGRYVLFARAIGPDGVTYEDRLPLDQIDDAIELIKGSPDWQLMNQLADLNKAAGGKLISPDQIGSLIEMLKERATRSTVSLVRSYHLGEGVIDSWLIFLVAAVLMSVQWMLRKRWSLA